MFVDLLGWQEVGRNPDYLAIFVSDGTIMITLWQARLPLRDFNKDNNIGLHHLALKVDSMQKLEAVYEFLWPQDIDITFSPEIFRQGPAHHMMCYFSGIRLEFIYPGNR